jgi:hypothetical protein
LPLHRPRTLIQPCPKEQGGSSAITISAS